MMNSERFRIDLKNLFIEEAKKSKLTKDDIALRITEAGGSTSRRTCVEWFRKNDNIAPPDSGISSVHEIALYGLKKPLSSFLVLLEGGISRSASLSTVPSSSLSNLSNQEILSAVDRNYDEVLNTFVDVKIEMGESPTLSITEAFKLKESIKFGIMFDLTGDKQQANAAIAAADIKKQKQA